MDAAGAAHVQSLEYNKDDVRKHDESRRALEAKIRAAELHGRSIDAELAKLDAERKKFEAVRDQSSSSVSMTAVERQLAGHAERMNALESEGLALIDELETARKCLAAMGGKREHIVARGTNAQTEDMQHQAERLAKRSALEARRLELLAALDGVTRTAYEDCVEQYGAAGAMTWLTNEVCGGCSSEATPQVLKIAEHGMKPVRCPTCRRLLLGVKTR